MKNTLLLLALSLTFVTASAQETKERTNKNRIFVSYGLNRTAYDLSDVSMKGDGYNFSLRNMDANDGFSEYDFAKFNGKIGFFITEQISISLGYDNFTYRNIANQLVKIDGEIEGGEFEAIYKKNEDVIRTSNDFMEFGYTTLNYINLNIEINDDFWVSKNGKLAWSYYFGLGGGILMSEGQTSLFGGEVVTENNGMNGFGGNASFGTRFHLGPVFLELGGKAGYLKSKDGALPMNGVSNHSFMFASGIASIGLSHAF